MVSERGHPKDAHGLAAWLRRAAPAKARGSVNIALVSDGCMRALNKKYRRRDYATDVLSFPNPQSLTPNPNGDLGEIVIALGVMHRQAREAGHHPKFELRLLALHGLLHLLGYDHERDDGQMRRMEERLRKRGGLREGLIERAAR